MNNSKPANPLVFVNPLDNRMHFVACFKRSQINPIDEGLPPRN